MARAHAGRLAAAALGWVADGGNGRLPAEIRALPLREQAAIIRAAASTANAARAAAQRINDHQTTADEAAADDCDGM